MLGELLSIGQDIMNNLFAAKRQDDAQDFSAQQFATRYQTTVKDMSAAGLNPMLAYNQGGGNAPTSSAASAPSAGNVGAIHLQSKLNAAQVANIEADTANKQAQADLIQAQVSQTTASASQSNAQVGLINANVNKINEEIKNIPVERDRLIRAAELLYQQANLTGHQDLTEVQRREVVAQTARKLVSETTLNNLDIAAAKNLDNLGRNSKELKPIVEMLISLIRHSR